MVRSASGGFLDAHQANKLYSEYADDFGTPNGVSGGGPSDFFFGVSFSLSFPLSLNVF